MVAAWRKCKPKRVACPSKSATIYCLADVTAEANSAPLAALASRPSSPFTPPIKIASMGDNNRLLYDIATTATWSPEESFLRNPGLTSTIYRRVINGLAHSLDGFVISTTVPPVLLQALPNLRSEWQLSLSPDGQYLAIFQESRIEIRPKKSEFETVHAYYNTRKDPFSKWRKLAWSPDSKLMAASRSDGTVEVLDTHGRLVCAILSKLASDASEINAANVADPTTNPDDTLSASPSSTQLDSASSWAFFIEPFAHVAFVNPRRGLKKPRAVDGHVYAYELLTVTYSGTIRSYLLNSAESAASSSGNPGMLLSRSMTVYVADRHDSDPNYFVFHHHFSVAPWMAAVTCGVSDPQGDVLCLGGRLRGTQGRAESDDKEDDDTSSGMTFWKMTYERPYYRRIGRSDGGEGAGEKINDTTGYLAQLKSAMASLTHYSARALWDDLVLTTVASPDGQNIVTLDLSGTIRVWHILWHRKDNKSENRPAIALSHTWDRAQLNHFARSNEYAELSLSALAKRIEAHRRDGDDLAKIPGLENGRVVSVQWWSADALVLGYARGTVIIARLPLMNNILGSQPELFRSCFEIATTSAHDQLLVLEHATKQLKAQLQDDQLVPLPQDLDSDLDNMDPPNVDLDAYFPTSFLSTPLARVVVTVARSLLRLNTPLLSSPDSTGILSIPQRYMRLFRVSMVPPLEYLHRKIVAEEYDAALAVAREFGLDTDIVHQARWRKVRVVNAEALEVLNSVTDKGWVFKVCLEHVPVSQEEARVLLEYGLRQTDAAVKQVMERIGSKTKGKDIQVDLSKEERAMVWGRLRFLKYLDRLSTFEEIVRPPEDSAGNENENTLVTDVEQVSRFALDYVRFRSADLMSEAVALARSEDFSALAVLFMRHGEEILPYRLSILDQVPETADPDAYERLLPRVVISDDDDEREDQREEVRWREEPWREKDWAEQDMVKKLLAGIDRDEDEESEDQGRKSAAEVLEPTPYPAPAARIAEWYTARARTIDERSGQVDRALTLVRQGMAGGVSSLERLEEDLTALARLVYECCPEVTSVAAELDLPGFEAMTEAEVVAMYLKGTDSERIVEDMRRFVVPYLKTIRRRRVKEGKDKTEDVMELLYQYLLDISIRHLESCCLVLEASKPSLPYEERVITDDKALARVSLAVLYGSDSLDQWTIMTRIFESLPVFEGIDNNSVTAPTKEASTSPIDIRILPPHLGPHDFFPALRVLDEIALTRAIDQLEIHLNAAEILSRYSCAVPLRWFLQSSGDTDAQRKLCVRLAAQAAGGVERGGERFESENEWMALLEDMLKLQDRGAGVLGTIPSEEMYTYFVTSLLRCGSILFTMDHFCFTYRAIGSQDFILNLALRNVLQTILPHRISTCARGSFPSESTETAGSSSGGKAGY